MNSKNVVSLVITVIAGFTALLLLHSCSSEKSVSPTDGLFTWDFSGTVIDGYDEKPLSNVTITYLDNNNDLVEVEASQQGLFHIKNLPAGKINFTPPLVFYVLEQQELALGADIAVVITIIREIPCVKRARFFAGCLSQ